MSIDAICGQIESHGASDYVCFSTAGLPAVRATGVFEASEERCLRAFALLQQSTALLQGDERLKRVTATFAGHSYVATVVTANDGQTYGLVVRR